MYIVLAGTADAPIALGTDPQIISRFVPFEIPRWLQNDEFRGLLKAFERVRPLRSASQLDQRPFVQFLLAASAGLTGEVPRLLTATAELAIRDRSERIILEPLEDAARPSH